MDLIVLMHYSEVGADPLHQLVKYGVVECPQLIQEILDSECVVSQILHVDAPSHLINQEEGRGRHPELAQSVHVLALLKQN